MNKTKGVHLHVHCEQSELDGLSTPEQLAERANELGMKALGLTDHGVMGGVPDLVKACQDRGIKPIPGCEIYTTADHKLGSQEFREMRELLAKDFKIYNATKQQVDLYKESLLMGNIDKADEILYKMKIKMKDINSFLSAAHKASYKHTEGLINQAKELLFDSYMNGLIEGDANTLDENAIHLIDRVKAEMKFRNFHMVVLAKNNQGLKNLYRITSDAHLYGFYRDPRTDLKYIRDNGLGEGLIATTACLGGYFAQCILSDQLEEAVEFVKECEATFEHFYLEKQATHIPDQIKVNEAIDYIVENKLVDSKKILTTDVHYARKEDIPLHDMLVASATNKCVSDENRLKYAEEFWLKSDDEMMYGCNDPEAWSNTLEIADLVDINFEVEPLLPVYSETEDTSKLLEQMSVAGLINRMKQEDFDLEEYIPRLEYELSIINKMGFADYFLVVQDYINASLNAGYPVGPGRGSAAGSLVCYTLGITQIDPIKYGLIFERFLNPERIGLPDILYLNVVLSRN